MLPASQTLQKAEETTLLTTKAYSEIKNNIRNN